MVSLKEQGELFKLIGEKLKSKIECFVIGGSAMLYLGVKDATKDIDLVFQNEGARKEVINILKGFGFSETNAGLLYIKKKNIPILLRRGKERIDLFSRKIISLELTDSIIERIIAVYEFDNFIIKIISPEDIILSKCATERAGDRLDAIEIMKRHDVNWDIVIKEAEHQTELGEFVFPVFLYDFLNELKEDFKADIPEKVINKIEEIAEKQMIDYMKEMKRKVKSA